MMAVDTETTEIIEVLIRAAMSELGKRSAAASRAREDPEDRRRRYQAMGAAGGKAGRGKRRPSKGKAPPNDAA